MKCSAMSLPDLRLLLVLAISLVLPSVAQAALDLCNDTSDPQNVAIGYKNADSWVSEGWWQVPVGECAEVVPGVLPRRFYYLRVETEGWVFTDDKLGFCVDDDDFSISGDDSCARRGFRHENFARIDTGPKTPDYSHSLSLNLKPADPDRAARIAAHPQFVSEAVFQGCETEVASYSSFCTFIGTGRRFLVYDDGRTSSKLWQQMQEITRGRRVELYGQRDDLFDTTSELVLTALVVQPENRFDRLLASLQGLWLSTMDPNDSFRVSGAERINSYAGAETSVEYISLQDSCADYDGEGVFLYTWDNNAGTSLCYQITRISDEELALTYLPRGTELVYRRES